MPVLRHIKAVYMQLFYIFTCIIV